MQSLLSSPLPTAINTFWEAYQSLQDNLEDDDTPECREAILRLQRAVQWMAPALFNAGIVGAIRAQILNTNAVICQLPNCLPTVAEIAMAAVERRRTEFHPRQTLIDFPHGTRHLPPPPEAGIGKSFEQANYIRETLDRKLSPGIWTDLRNRIDDYLIASLVPKALQDHSRNRARANDALAAISSGGRRYYLVCKLPAAEADRAKIENDLQTLKHDYSALVILGLLDHPDLETQEMKDFNAFCFMLPVRKSA